MKGAVFVGENFTVDALLVDKLSFQSVRDMIK